MKASMRSTITLTYNGEDGVFKAFRARISKGSFLGKKTSSTFSDEDDLLTIRSSIKSNGQKKTLNLLYLKKIIAF